MIFGYDQALQMPVKDLYDTQMMAYAIETAKDMYNEGQKRLDDFYTKYGDFTTPILKDQEYWNNNILGAVTNGINAIYDRGGDPLRNASDRAELYGLIRNLPYGKVNELKSSADNAREYLKARRDLIANDKFDPEFEKFRLNGNTMEGWDTVNNGIFNETSPAEFKDMNTWTHHLFDNMELSFDPEETKKYPGYKAYTKNRDTMGTIVDNNIAQLLGTNLGKYYFNDVMNSIPADFNGDRQAEALRRMRDRIIDANWENSQVKLEADPYALARYQANLRASYGGSRGGGGGQRTQSPSYNYLSGVFQRGITAPFGYDTVTGGEEAMNNIMKNQFKFGQSMVGKFANAEESYKSKRQAYLNQFTIWESPQMFPFAMNRKPVDSMGSIRLTYDDLQHLMTEEDVITYTYGYPGEHISTNVSGIPTQLDGSLFDSNGNVQKDAKGNVSSNDIVMTPYRDIYTAYRKTGSTEAQWKVKVHDITTGKDYGDYWVTLPIGSDPNDVVPSITDWQKNTQTGEWQAPTDSRGNSMDKAKIGLNPRTAGMTETHSWRANQGLGVPNPKVNSNSVVNWESLSRSPF